MQHSRPGEPDATVPRAAGFFIPDLCAPQAVFLAVLLAELVVLLHVLALAPLAAFDWRALATVSLFVQWNTMLSLALICWLRRYLQGLSPTAATTACLGLVLMVSVLSSALVYLANPVLTPENATFADWLLRNGLLAVLLAAVVLRYSYLQQRVAMQQSSELQLRLDALRSRIRPHFLFNTLNSIASLISVQPERAEQAIEDVAELFRAALAGGANSSLGDECHLCSLYLDIEKLRLGERLSVRWDTDDSLDATPIPGLLVQPLVENAVYHGVSQLPGGGEVSIRTFRQQGTLGIEVENPLPEQGGSGESRGHRMALDNIRQRLDALYGPDAALETHREARKYRALIRIPLPAGAASP